MLVAGEEASTEAPGAVGMIRVFVAGTVLAVGMKVFVVTVVVVVVVKLATSLTITGTSSNLGDTPAPTTKTSALPL